MKEITIDGIKYVPKSSVKQPTKAFKPVSSKGKEYVIVRTYSAGVFAGLIDRKQIKGKVGRVYNARRIWYWDGANSLSQLAMEGTKKPENCKFPMVVPYVDLTEIIEILPCSKEAKESIEGVPEWKK